MEVNCSKPECKNPVTYYCLFCQPIQNFCQKCSISHLNKNLGHKVRKLYVKINSDKFQKIVSLKNKFIEDIDKVSKSITHSYSNIIKNAQSQLKEILNRLADIQNTYLLMFKDIFNSNLMYRGYFRIIKSLVIPDECKRVFVPNKALQDIPNICPYFDFLGEIQNHLKNPEIKIEVSVPALATQASSESREIYPLSDTSSINSDLNRSSAVILQEPVNISYLFYPDGKNIKILDLELKNYIDQSQIFKTQIDAKVFSSCCNIENNYFFYNIEKKSYLLNFRNNTAQELPAFDSSLVGRGCAAKNKTAYLFGGFTNNTSSKDCHKIDLDYQNWNLIAPLPNPSKFNSASNINNNLYVVGYNLESLLFYDDIRNNFKPVQKISPELKIFCDNWIIINSESYVLEIKDGRPTKHKLDRKSYISTLVISCSFRNDKYIYFVEQGERITIQRFNTLDKTLVKIR